MKLISFESLYEDLYKINEGLKDLHASFVDAGKVSEEEFDFFVDSDPSSTKKYLQWMLTNYLLHKDRKRHIIDMVVLFDKKVQKNQIKNKDIFSYSFESLEKALEGKEEEKTKTEIKKEAKVEGAEKVFENDEILIVSPLTHKASCFYGSGTKWCTAGREDGYFNYYRKEDKKLYYIIDKKKNQKYAIAISKEGEEEAFLSNNRHTTRKSIGKKIGMDLSPYIKPFSEEQLAKIKENEIKEAVDEILSRSTKNNDGSYDVEGDVSFAHLSLKKLPVKFGKVGGDFHCAYNQLTTLEGAPIKVGGGFYCFCNQLTTLEGAPKEVGGDFYCFHNQLTTLEGAPIKVGGDFDCSDNPVSKQKLKKTVKRSYLK